MGQNESKKKKLPFSRFLTFLEERVILILWICSWGSSTPCCFGGFIAYAIFTSWRVSSVKKIDLRCRVWLYVDYRRNLPQVQMGKKKKREGKWSGFLGFWKQVGFLGGRTVGEGDAMVVFATGWRGSATSYCHVSSLKTKPNYETKTHNFPPQIFEPSPVKRKASPDHLLHTIHRRRPPTRLVASGKNLFFF
jgi:hypothetical protein